MRSAFEPSPPTKCRVIAISRSLAGGGEEVGRIVAKELGFRYVDEQIVMMAADEAGVSPELIAGAERTPGLTGRILAAAGRVAVDPEAWSAHTMLSAQTSPSYEDMIERVIRETSQEGDCVIVAHGASICLAGLSGLLRVLVTASPEARAQRLVQQTNLGERQANKAIRDSDRQRRDYLRRLYNVRQELPTHYDVVLNTDVLAVPLAAELVLRAAKSWRAV
jgi:cytidylate kinase